MENRFDARDRLNALSTGTKILLPAAILLLIDLFLPWQDFGNEFTEAVGVDVSWSGWHGFWGILLGLVTLALIVWIGLQLAGVDLSGVNLPVTQAMITLGLGVLLLAVAIIKLITILGDEPTIWAFIGTILAAVAAYGAYQRSREMEELAPVGGGADVDRTTTTGTSDRIGTTGTTTGTETGPDDVPPTTTPGGPMAGGLVEDPTPRTTEPGIASDEPPGTTPRRDDL